MAREITPEMRAAMQRGGQWLRQARERAGYATVTSFAEALGIKQVRLSTYERGQYQVEPEIARRIAEVLGLSELDVWQGLELPLPRGLTMDDIGRLTDKQAIAYVRQHWPGAIEEVLRQVAEATPDQPGRKPRRRSKRAADVTRKDEPGRSASHG